MLQAGFEPATLVSKGQYTQALDRLASGIGFWISAAS